MAIGLFANQLIGQKYALGDAVNNHEIIAKPVHFRKLHIFPYFLTFIKSNPDD